MNILSWSPNIFTVHLLFVLAQYLPVITKPISPLLFLMTVTFTSFVSLSWKEYEIIVKALLEHVLLICPLYIYPRHVYLYPMLLNDNLSCNTEYQLFEVSMFLCMHDDLWYVHQIKSLRQVCMKSCTVNSSHYFSPLADKLFLIED